MTGIITVEELTQAIKNSPNNRGIDEVEAGDLALHVLNFFGYSERIIDNILEPEAENLSVYDELPDDIWNRGSEQ